MASPLQAQTPTHNHNEVDLDRSAVKLVALGATGTFLAFGFGADLLMLIHTGAALFWWGTGVSGILFLGVALLDAFFVKSTAIRTVMLAVEMGACLAPFYGEMSVGFLVAAAASYVILLGAHRAGRNELAELVHVKFFRIAHVVLPKAIVALAIVAAAAYYGFARDALARGNVGALITETQFAAFSRPVTSLAHFFMPGVTPSSTTRDVIQAIANSELSGNPALQALPEHAKKQMLTQAAQSVEKQIAGVVGDSLDLGGDIAHTLYTFMEKKLQEAPESTRGTVAMAVAVLLALAIAGLMWPIRLLVAAVAFLLYEMCIALGFASITLETRSREIIVLR